MSKQLDDLLDNYISKVDETLLCDEKDADKKAEIIEAAKKQIKQSIYEEISNEIKESALRDADRIIEEKADLKRIEEFRNLTVQGFIVAFFVGLLVNQVTDIIGFYKGSINMESIKSTFVIAIVLLIICVSIFAYVFLITLLKMWRKAKNDEAN